MAWQLKQIERASNTFLNKNACNFISVSEEKVLQSTNRGSISCNELCLLTSVSKDFV